MTKPWFDYLLFILLTVAAWETGHLLAALTYGAIP